MDPILELLQQNAQLTAEQIADRLDLDPAEVAETIADLEKRRVILGYHAVIDLEKTDNHKVVAEIDVKLTPERGGGFDHLAERIAKFDQVTDCYLMSGGYDLAVVVEGEDLREVARFVTERLSTIEGVISTVTHFQLKVYKQNGFLAAIESETERLPVTP